MRTIAVKHNNNLTSFWRKELDWVKASKEPRQVIKKAQPRERIDFGHVVPGAYLTLQENRCVCHLLRGKTAAQTAEDMGLSKRSVEFYLLNVKKKFGCKKKRALLDLMNSIDYFAVDK
jgi:DNA-binding CsgD family transcriptional regulator